MKVSIHQPHLFPWLPYFVKIAASDIFVFYDNVQYRKNYFQNRCIVKDSNDKNQWLTVPVKKNQGLQSKINSIELSDQFINTAILKNLERDYKNQPYYNETMELIIPILSNHSKNLSQITTQSCEVFLKKMEISTTIFKASELNLAMAGNATQNIVEIINRVKGDCYVSSTNSSKYLDLNVLSKNEKNILWLDTNAITRSLKFLEIDATPSVIHFCFLYGVEQVGNAIKRIADNFIGRL